MTATYLLEVTAIPTAEIAHTHSDKVIVAVEP